MVREIYSLRETLTKNFEVNSTNVTDSSERPNEHTNVYAGGITSKEDIANTFGETFLKNSPSRRGWSGGAMVLGKLPVPGRPTYLDHSRARAHCACSRCGLRLFGHFFSCLSFLTSFSLSLGDGPI